MAQPPDIIFKPTFLLQIPSEEKKFLGKLAINSGRKKSKGKKFYFPPFLAFLHPGNQKLSERERKRQREEKEREV